MEADYCRIINLTRISFSPIAVLQDLHEYKDGFLSKHGYSWIGLTYSLILLNTPQKRRFRPEKGDLLPIIQLFVITGRILNDVVGRQPLFKLLYTNLFIQFLSIDA